MMANQRLADDVMNLLLMNDIANDFTYRTIITYEFNNGIWENNSPEKLTTYDVDIYFSTGSAIFKVLSISDSLHNNQLVKHIETEQYASSSSATINEFDSNGNVYSSINKGIYSNNNCSSISLSVENENILEDVSLYPNPTNMDKFYLNVPLGMDDLDVTIYNILGAKLYHETGFTGGEVTINIGSKLSMGTYFVKLSSQGRTTTKKLTIN